jgi:ppGpp synthetase/RelA/SpoT-type nucleotidyltranferase
MIFWNQQALGTVIRVVTGNGTDLKQAIEVTANTNDIVELPPGTYQLPSQITWPNIDGITVRPVAGADNSTVIIEPAVVNSYRFTYHNNNVGLTIEDVTIRNFGKTTSGFYGGVFYSSSGSSAQVTLNRVILNNNKGYFGGVAYYGNHIWRNTIVFSSYAHYYGGVAYYGTHNWLNTVAVSNNARYSGGVGYRGTHRWLQCSVSMNHATQEIFFDNNGSISVNNSILAGKLLAGSAYTDSEFNGVLATNDYPGNYNGLTCQRLIMGDPGFLDANLLIPTTSIAVGAGSNYLWDTYGAGVTTDLTGNTRVNGTIDLGAYEVGDSNHSDRVSRNNTGYYYLDDALVTANTNDTIEIITDNYQTALVVWPNTEGIRLQAQAALSDVVIESLDSGYLRFLNHNYAVGLTIEDVTIRNFGKYGSNFYGGVFYSPPGTAAQVTLNRVTLKNNQAYYGGVAYYGNHTWRNTIVFNNYGMLGGVAYYGTHNWLNTVAVSNNVISGGGVGYRGTHRWVQCSVSMNSTTREIFYSSTSDSISVNNSILAGKLLAGNRYSDSEFNGVLVNSDYPGNYNNLTAYRIAYGDPLFLDTNLLISGNSLAVGLGSNDLWADYGAGVTTDLTGNARVNDRIDLGAYEVGGDANVKRVSINNVSYYFLDDALVTANANDVIEIITTNYRTAEIVWPNTDGILLKPEAALSGNTVIIEAFASGHNRFLDHSNDVGLTIEDVTIQNFGKSITGFYGGVFYSPSGSDARVSLNRVILKDNQAIYGAVAAYGTHEWRQVIAKDNQSTYGGVAYYGEHNWWNTVAANNNASASSGGGVAYRGTYQWVQCSVSMDNTTREICYAGAGWLKVYNSILAGKLLNGGNSNCEYNGVLVNVDYPWRYDSTGLIYRRIAVGNPQFLDNNLLIPTNSVAVGAGSQYLFTTYGAGVTLDVTGNPRVNSKVDLGAYEVGGDVYEQRVSVNNVSYYFLEDALLSANADAVMEILTNNYQTVEVVWPSINNLLLKPQASLLSAGTVFIRSFEVDYDRFLYHNNPVGLTIEDVTICDFGNTEVDDGGVFFAETNNYDSKVTLNRVTLENNQGNDGGISHYGTHIWLDTIASGNYCNSKGGVSFYGNHTWQRVRVHNSRGGTTAYGAVSYKGTHLWQEVILKNNQAYNGGVSYYGTHTWYSTVAASNNATSKGGVGYRGTHQWVNCSVSMNNTLEIFSDYNDSDIKVYNSILAGKLLDDGPYSGNEYNGVLFTSDYPWLYSGVDYRRVTLGDPQFLDSELRLPTNSMAVGAGSNYLWTTYGSGVTQDVTGNPRLSGNIDLGAYELGTNNDRVSRNNLGYYFLDDALLTTNTGTVIEIVTTNYQTVEVVWPSTNGLVLKPHSSLSGSTVIIEPWVIGYDRFLDHREPVGLTIEEVTIRNFGNTDINFYGGVFVADNGDYEPQVTLNGVTLENNRADDGGVAYYGSHTWRDSVASGNFADGNGGVTYYGNHDWDQVILNNNRAAIGGVAYAGTHTWNNTVAVSNNASNWGGVGYRGTHQWVNCSVSMNNSTDIFYSGVGDSLKVYNSILAGKLLYGTAGWANCSYDGVLCVNDYPWLYTSVTDYQRLIVGDPSFVNTELLIATNSVAVGAGSDYLWTTYGSGVTRDMAGNARLNGCIDLGAYEVGTNNYRVSINNQSYYC